MSLQSDADDQGRFAVEIILKDGSNSFHEEHGHSDQQDGAANGARDCEQDGDELG